MIRRADDAIQAVTEYLASERGRDAAPPVAVRLKRLPWHLLLPDRTPSDSDVHLVRGIIERNRERRVLVR